MFCVLTFNLADPVRTTCTQKNGRTFRTFGQNRSDRCITSPSWTEGGGGGRRLGGWGTLGSAASTRHQHTNIAADTLPLSCLYTRSPGTLVGLSWLLLWKRGKPGNGYLVTNEISTSNYIGLDWNFKSPVLPRNCNNFQIWDFLGLKGQPIYFSNTKKSGIPKYVDREKHPLTVLYI